MDKIDLFPIKPKILINKRESIHSKLGFILTVLTIVLSLFISLPNIKDFIDRKSYTVSYGKEYKQQYKLDFSDDPIFIGLAVEQIKSYSNWEKIIELSAYQIIVSYNDTKRIENYVKLDVQNCLSNKKYQENLNLITDFMKKFPPPLCLKSANNNLTIYGHINNLYESSFIYVEISKCKNSTEKNFTCFSLNTIDDFLSNSVFFWGSFDYNLDHESSGNPFKPKFFLEWFTFNSYALTKFYAMFKQVLYESDAGWFLRQLETYSYSMHDETEVILLNRSNLNPTAFLELIVITSGRREIHRRKYERVQQLLAEILAVMKMISGFCALFVGSFGEKIYYDHLIDCFLSFNEPENKKKFNTFMQVREELFGDFNQKKHDDITVNHERLDKKAERNHGSAWIELQNINFHRESNFDSKTNLSDTKFCWRKRSRLYVKEPSTQVNQRNSKHSTFRNLNDYTNNKLNDTSISKLDKVPKIRKIINSKLQIPKNKLNNLISKENPIVTKEKKAKDIDLIKEEEEEEEEKQSYVGKSIKDHMISNFSKNSNSSIEKYNKFVSVFKELLSVELIVKEINDLLDIKKKLELQLG